MDEPIQDMLCQISELTLDPDSGLSPSRKKGPCLLFSRHTEASFHDTANHSWYLVVEIEIYKQFGLFLWSRHSFNANTPQPFLKSFLGHFSLIFAILQRCHRQEATSQSNCMSARGRKNTGPVIRLDGWQNETTERQQITVSAVA